MVAKRLPSDVLKFLRENPEEVEHIRRKMSAIESNKKWRAEIEERRRNAPMVECGAYGCTKLKNAMDVLCKSCEADYREDPDAFK